MISISHNFLGWFFFYIYIYRCIFIYLCFIFILFFNFTILYWFCHISTWIHHRYTRVPHPEPSSFPMPSLWVIPVHQPQASSIVHRTWTGDSFHIWYYTCFNAILPNHPTLSLSHRVQKTVIYICVSFAVSSQWTPGIGDGQRGLPCCNSWGHKESDTTEWLIWSDLIQGYCFLFPLFV